tara:strand:+ start:829 stop:1146 length:318 start_codon:yes stop_codon:yes gene_type:complete
VPHLKQTINRVQRRKKASFFLKQRGERRLNARVNTQQYLSLKNAKMPYTTIMLDILHAHISHAEASLEKLTLAMLSVSIEDHIYNYDYELDLTTVVCKHLKRQGY